MKRIRTKDGYTIMVDDEDYEYVSQLPLHVSRNKQGNKTGVIQGVYLFMTLGRLLLKPSKNLHVDHINNDPLDNRRCNLRIVTASMNMQNRRKASRTGRPTTSRFKGVYLRIAGNYHSWISVRMENGKKLTKYFPATHQGEILAALYYDMKVLEIYGPQAKTNFLAARPA